MRRGDGTAVPASVENRSRAMCARRAAMIVLLRAPFFIAAILALVVAAQPAIAQDRLTIFAAASMKNALDDVDAAFTQSTGIEIAASYAATSSLVKQIEAGAPADIFLSADTEWMEYAQAHKLIAPGTRFNLLGNRLVLIAPLASRIDAIHIEPGMNLAS